jgi:uncharacterized protein
MKKIIFLLIVLITLNCSLSLGQPADPGRNDSLKKKTLEFMDFMKNKDFVKASANFDKKMTQLVPPEQLEKYWASILTQYGELKSFKNIESTVFQGFVVIIASYIYEKGEISTRLTFDSAYKIAGLYFVPAQNDEIKYDPPDYVKQVSFIESEVTIGAGTEWALPATLTVPKNVKKCPVLILVHGSGPHDRDETVGPNKPFRDLAWGLASNGIAVLRYEKRTKVYPEKFMNMKDSLTINEETVFDAVEAEKLLKNQDNIDKKKIFVLGHSQGGYLFPRIGILDTNMAGFISLAGLARPLPQTVVDQYNYIFSLDGEISDEEQKALNTVLSQVKEVTSPELNANTPADKLLFGIGARYWLDLRDYNPPELAKKVKKPILILQGGRDYQVKLDDFDLWKKSLSSRKDVEFKMYPKMNHLFISGEGKPVPEDYQIAGHVDKQVINDIIEWIKKN